MELSPFQIWFALAVILIIAEVSTLSFFLLWPGIAALILALVMLVFPSISLIWQLVVFALVTLILIVPGRRAALRWKSTQTEHNINKRSQSLIGDTVTVVSIDGTNLRVKHGDTEWSAKSSDQFKKGDTAVINHVDGIILSVARTQ